MATIDIANFVFTQLLKMDPSSPLISGEIGKDIIFVIVIPAAVSLLIFYSIIGPILGDHKKLRLLFGVGGLGAIIYLGLYELIAQWSKILFIVWFLVGGAYVLYAKTVGKAGHGALMGAGGWLFKKFGGKTTLGIDPTIKLEIQETAKSMIAAAAQSALADEEVRVFNATNNPELARGRAAEANEARKQIVEYKKKLIEVLKQHGKGAKEYIDEQVQEAIKEHIADRSLMETIGVGASATPGGPNTHDASLGESRFKTRAKQTWG